MKSHVLSAFRTAARVAATAAVLVLLGASFAAAQGTNPAPPGRAKVIAAAREIIAPLQYCALVTVDQAGELHVRTMNPFPPEEDMAVWMATTTLSRKVQEIRRNPRVSLYYADQTKAAGYVTISGRAVLVDDMKEILKRKRAYWDQAFPGLKNIVLIKVVPERLEVVNYKAKLGADPETFRATTITMGAK